MGGPPNLAEAKKAKLSPLAHSHGNEGWAWGLAYDYVIHSELYVHTGGPNPTLYCGTANP